MNESGFMLMGTQPLTNLNSATNLCFSNDSFTFPGSLTKSHFHVNTSLPSLSTPGSLEWVLSMNIYQQLSWDLECSAASSMLLLQSNANIAECNASIHTPPITSHSLDTCIADALETLHTVKIDDKAAEDFWENASISSMSSA